MEIANDDIARLDMAAQARVGEESLMQTRQRLAAICLFLVIWAFLPRASYHGILYVRFATVLTALATGVLWLNWRFKLYLMLLLWLAAAVLAIMLWNKHPYYVDDWGQLLVALTFGYFIGLNDLLKRAGASATTTLPGWEKERQQISRWRELLQPSDMPDGVIEFSTGNSWSGRCTYRLLRPGPYWVIAKFQASNLHRLLDYRVRGLNEVTFTPLLNSEMKVTIGDCTLWGFKVSPSMFGAAAGSSLLKNA